MSQIPGKRPKFDAIADALQGNAYPAMLRKTWPRTCRSASPASPCAGDRLGTRSTDQQGRPQLRQEQSRFLGRPHWRRQRPGDRPGRPRSLGRLQQVHVPWLQAGAVLRGQSRTYDRAGRSLPGATRLGYSSPCPVCGNANETQWCAVASNGAVCWCHRKAEGAEKSREGGRGLPARPSPRSLRRQSPQGEQPAPRTASIRCWWWRVGPTRRRRWTWASWPSESPLTSAACRRRPISWRWRQRRRDPGERPEVQR